MARPFHVFSAFWGFVLMALHIGLHWNMILGMVRKAAGPVSSQPLRILLCIVAATVAGYGFYALLKNQFLSYMLLTSSFVFFDFEGPVLLFFTEYIAIMGLFIFLAHYASKWIQKLAGRRKKLVEKKIDSFLFCSYLCCYFPGVVHPSIVGGWRTVRLPRSWRR